MCKLYLNTLLRRKKKLSPSQLKTSIRYFSVSLWLMPTNVTSYLLHLESANLSVIHVYTLVLCSHFGTWQTFLSTLSLTNTTTTLSSPALMLQRL